MNAFVAVKNNRGAETVRLSDDDLHRAARKSLHDGNHVVFRILPATISQLIDNKVWKSRTRTFKNFGEYALDQTSDGLGIENNQLLWLLRCSLDIDGTHVTEWASVLEEVERSVKVQAKVEGKKIRDFHGNSLETLGKACAGLSTENRITYLPSRNTNNFDGRLIRLKRLSPESYHKFIAGKLSVREALDEANRQKREAKRKEQQAARRAISKQTLARQEKRRRDDEERARGINELQRTKAIGIIELIGEDHARSVVEILNPFDGWQILEHLRREVRNLDSDVVGGRDVVGGPDDSAVEAAEIKRIDSFSIDIGAIFAAKGPRRGH